MCLSANKKLAILASFNNEHLEHSRSLFKYIWDLKAKNTNFRLKWRILTSASAYCNTTKRCNLCIQENFYILCKPLLASLNKRSELFSSCRHISKYIFSKHNNCIALNPNYTLRVILMAHT